ncbi:MAG: prolipoprotein diacylglyceryl transferase [Syntrophothermus sp.]
MPEGFFIGTFEIRFYGIILMLGAVAGAYLATHQAKRKGYSPDIVWDLMIYLLIGGIIGARLWHILTPTPTSGVTAGWYFTHPLDALNIRKGGLGIPGAVIGGLIVMYFYARRHDLNFLHWVDIASPALAFGQAIGRWGNYVNQELYGAPTSLPWKLYIDPQHRLPGYENVSYYHPLFLYESLWNLANMFILLWMSGKYRDRLKDGDIFLTYLVIYPTGRFLLDFLRLDKPFVGGFDINQIVMAVIAVSAAVALFLRHRPSAVSDPV